MRRKHEYRRREKRGRFRRERKRAVSPLATDRGSNKKTNHGDGMTDRDGKGRRDAQLVKLNILAAIYNAWPAGPFRTGIYYCICCKLPGIMLLLLLAHVVSPPPHAWRFCSRLTGAHGAGGIWMRTTMQAPTLTGWLVISDCVDTRKVQGSLRAGQMDP